jgi:hypothetical protein
MLLKRCAVLVFALMPLAASAQAPAGLQRIGPGVPGAPGAGGITVQARAVVRYPVKTLSFLANTRGNADEPAVIAAMRAAGIDDPVIGPMGSQMNNGTQAMARGVIHDVTRAKLDRIGLAAAAYMAAHPGTTVDNVSFYAVTDDCAAREQAARAAALADARRKAEAIAALAGVALDGVAAVNESGGCPAAGDSPLPPFAQGGSPFDLATLTASVSVVENVTFAIVPGAATARRKAL